MITRICDLQIDEITSLPLDQLALHALIQVDSVPERTASGFVHTLSYKGIKNEALKCCVEALNWLISNNLVAQPNPLDPNTADSLFVTRLGKNALETETGFERIRVIQRLDYDLHPKLEGVKTQFLIGQYELGAFAAMREVEIRVRELSGASPSLLGVKLMTDAFREGGTLASPDLDPGERHGMMQLFAGAIGTFKNPPSHRQVNYASPTEASEVILFADLLMRLLDRSKSIKEDG